jgi:putative transposase
MEGTPKTDDMMNLRTLVEETPDADFLREIIGFVAERLIEMGVGAVTGTAHGEKNPPRTAQRNGYREQHWETRAGTAERVSRSFGEAATSQVSWSRGGSSRRR